AAALRTSGYNLIFENGTPDVLLIAVFTVIVIDYCAWRFKFNYSDAGNFHSRVKQDVVRTMVCQFQGNCTVTMPRVYEHGGLYDSQSDARERASSLDKKANGVPNCNSLVRCAE